MGAKRGSVIPLAMHIVDDEADASGCDRDT
jgi:hypothetical protein